ncbi:mesenteric estrogen-dependent adipogenesis protein [Austrofundulus limnaeus]|uniref:Mesenteric estrogen-dependent adipogenesis protein n=1 Tax=Austrofundulus limnaeus TaxID=52670 RepID=A0A2I4ATF5_AUSLI|nr:PREDICTED: mesenteric estrogen-dependent adipogenesis protein [Austrofundulus limnaeus]
MTVGATLGSRVTVTEVGEFLKSPPDGFCVERLGSSGYRVQNDEDKNLVLIDDFQSSSGRIVFHNSLGRKVKMQNLWEYSRVRKSLLSKRIYLTVSNKKELNHLKAVQRQYVVSVDGGDPFIRWQLERGLDWTISSVAGESYRVDVDLTEALESLVVPEEPKQKPVWRDASFTLKYYSDALFDFPHWFGFSKRTFKLRLMKNSCG